MKIHVLSDLQALSGHINCKIAEHALTNLELIAIDEESRAPDIISDLKIIAEKHNAAPAHLPTPMLIRPKRFLDDLAQITDDLAQQKRIQEVRYALILARPRSGEFAHWTKDEVEGVLQCLDRAAMLAPFNGPSDIDPKRRI